MVAHHLRLDTHLKKALQNLMRKHAEEHLVDDEGNDREFWVALFNLPNVDTLRSLRSAQLGRLVAFQVRPPAGGAAVAVDSLVQNHNSVGFVYTVQRAARRRHAAQLPQGAGGTVVAPLWRTLLLDRKPAIGLARTPSSQQERGCARVWEGRWPQSALLVHLAISPSPCRSSLLARHWAAETAKKPLH